MIVSNLKATYTREIERKPLNNIIFYGGMASIVFIVLFVFGIRPIFVALAQNRKYLMEMTEIRNNMKTKLEQVRVAEEQIQTVGKEVENLNTAIPDDILPQEFLQEAVIESAGAGYAVQRVAVNDAEGNLIPVELDVAGPLGRLGEFIEKLENMKRFVTIEDVRLNMDEGTAMVKLKVRIYKL